MSKVSVFKFRLNGQSQEIANNIVRKYVESRGMVFYQEMNCFLSGNPNTNNTAKDVALSAGLSAAASLATGGATTIAVSTLLKGLECQIVGDELLIKCFIYNPKGKLKNIIHSAFNNTQTGALYLGDLKANLFKELNAANIPLIKTETEKINDGAEGRVLKKVLLIFLIMILICAALVFIVLQP